MDPFDTLADVPPGPPPAYESVIGGCSSVGPAASSFPKDSDTAPAPSCPKDFEISVTDPTKVGDGMTSYVTYKASTVHVMLFLCSPCRAIVYTTNLHSPRVSR